tara:strand:+ start:370 stop:519 length:150 start_codon:yes stop_codon:yes gene_type:complete
MFWNRINQISVEDAKKLIKEEGVLLYDVRRPANDEKSHAPGPARLQKDE